MDLLSDNPTLLDRFRRGERRALDEVYRHYAPMVAAFLRRGFVFCSGGCERWFGGFTQPFELENAFQDTFVHAFVESARRSYDGVRSYKSYLLAIARNVAVDQLRRGACSRDHAPPLGGAADDACDHAQALDGEHAVLQRELAALFATFLCRLDARDRAFFISRFADERTQIDAGARVGLSHMGARTLEKRLRRAFLEFLRANGYFTNPAGAEGPATRGALTDAQQAANPATAASRLPLS
jgi:RNA polymerase sigma factor (sigma-70 family)